MIIRSETTVQSVWLAKKLQMGTSRMSPASAAPLRRLKDEKKLNP